MYPGTMPDVHCNSKANYCLRDGNLTDGTKRGTIARELHEFQRLACIGITETMSAYWTGAPSKIYFPSCLRIDAECPEVPVRRGTA